eukprot:scpid86620/ scgid14481/ 
MNSAEKKVPYDGKHISNNKGRIIWSGPLLNKDKFLANVTLLSYCGEPFPGSMCESLNIKTKATFAKVRAYLPVPVFRTGPPAVTRSPSVQHGPNRYYYCELSVQNDQYDNVGKLCNYFLMKEWAGLVEWSNRKIYIIPSCSLSHELGLTIPDAASQVRSVHVLCAWKDGTCPAAPIPATLSAEPPRTYSTKVRVKRKGEPPLAMQHSGRSMSPSGSLANSGNAAAAGAGNGVA